VTAVQNEDDGSHSDSKSPPKKAGRCCKKKRIRKRDAEIAAAIYGALALVCGVLWDIFAHSGGLPAVLLGVATVVFAVIPVYYLIGFHKCKALPWGTLPAAAACMVGVCSLIFALIVLMTVDRTGETARAGEPAFIGASELAIKQIRSAQNEVLYEFSLNWENSGTIAPKELELYVGHIIGKDIPEVFPDLGTGIPSVLLPKQSFSVGDLIVNGNKLDNMRWGAGQIRAFGMAEYKGAFGDRHITIVCYDVIVNPLLDYNQADSKPTSQPCVKYNCIDAECSRYAGQKPVADALRYLKEK
jgi:hypothetical protein